MASTHGLSFKQRLPDILLESLFIVAALLGALAIDEWREENERAENALRAQSAIIEEMKTNLHQLTDKQNAHQLLLDNINSNIKAFELNPDETLDFNFNYSMVLLSAAAWDSARMTQSVQYMSLDDVSQYSKIYRFQELFIDNQDKLIEKVMTLGEVSNDGWVPFAKGFAHRLQILLEINRDLSQAYTNVLNETQKHTQ